MMEQTIYITKISNLKYVNEKYSRIYFGNEFCQRIIPSSSDLNRVLTHIQKRRLNFSLVTPYVTDEGLEKLKTLFELLKNRKFSCEVIINDWGVLNLVNRKYLNLTPVLGRLLTKQKRGPELVELLKREIKPRLIKDTQNPGIRHLVFQKKFPLDLDPYYKGSNAASVPIIHNFLISQRIKRLELDNIAQGLLLDLPKGKISASVYLPYVYINTTFFCPTAGCDRKKKSIFKIKPCKKQCQRYVFKLRHRTMPRVIYLRGNTQFYKNTRLPMRELEKSGVNRIVYQPEIPI